MDTANIRMETCPVAMTKEILKKRGCYLACSSGYLEEDPAYASGLGVLSPGPLFQPFLWLFKARQRRDFIGVVYFKSCNHAQAPVKVSEGEILIHIYGKNFKELWGGESPKNYQRYATRK
ncbi:hypothetical protein ACFL3M_03065 [Patescibacteria group bacterium]